MKQLETRVEYMDAIAIAKAMGLGGIDDLAYEHRNVLQVEHFVRLAPILDLVETVAGQSGGCRLPRTTVKRWQPRSPPSTVCCLSITTARSRP